MEISVVCGVFAVSLLRSAHSFYTTLQYSIRFQILHVCFVVQRGSFSACSLLHFEYHTQLCAFIYSGTIIIRSAARMLYMTEREIFYLDSLQALCHSYSTYPQNSFDGVVSVCWEWKQVNSVGLAFNGFDISKQSKF